MTVLELEANTTNTWEATILVENLGVFNTRLAELAAKAAKLGVEPMTAVELERSFIKVTREGREIEVPTVTLLLSGSTPVLAGGWKFLGAIEHAVNGVTLVHGDDARLLALRELPAFCDHCQTQRLRRKTMVVESAAGELVRVGSSCMKDFLGYHGNPERYLEWFQDFGREVRELGEGGRTAMTVDLETYVSVCAATMRHFGGFISRSASNSGATADFAALVLFPSSYAPKDHTAIAREIRDDVCDADRVLAAAAIEWAKALDADNSYLINLSEVCSTGVLLNKHFGLAASLVSAYQRDGIRAAREAAKAEEVHGVVVAGRYAIEGTVLSTKYVENDFGGSLKMLVQVEQADGTVRLWGSVPSSIDPAIGDKVRFTAAVELGREDDFGFYKRPTKAEVVAA